MSNLLAGLGRKAFFSPDTGSHYSETKLLTLNLSASKSTPSPPRTVRGRELRSLLLD